MASELNNALYRLLGGGSDQGIQMTETQFEQLVEPTEPIVCNTGCGCPARRLSNDGDGRKTVYNPLGYKFDKHMNPI